MIPSQKFGTERPQRETALASRSHTVLRRTAEKTPAGMAMVERDQERQAGQLHA